MSGKLSDQSFGYRRHDSQRMNFGAKAGEILLLPGILSLLNIHAPTLTDVWWWTTAHTCQCLVYNDIKESDEEPPPVCLY
jgi:hypothetical protein